MPRMPRVERPDALLYYERYGSGPAVVFAHGAGGNTLIWYQQVPAFARDHTVLVFDHRGFGRSTAAPGALHARAFPDDLRAILDHAGVARAALVCQSMGGWTGLPSAIAFPDRISALVLSGTPGGVFTPLVAGAFERIAGIARSEGIRAGPALAPDFPER